MPRLVAVRLHTPWRFCTRQAGADTRDRRFVHADLIRHLTDRDGGDRAGDRELRPRLEQRFDDPLVGLAALAQRTEQPRGVATGAAGGWAGPRDSRARLAGLPKIQTSASALPENSAGRSIRKLHGVTPVSVWSLELPRRSGPATDPDRRASWPVRHRSVGAIKAARLASTAWPATLIAICSCGVITSC